MIKVLAIYGSPKETGNGALLVDKVLEGLGTQEIEVSSVYTATADIMHCTACGGCYTDGHCTIEDEMQRVYSAIDEADIVITATPVYFYNVTSTLKKLIDRCQAIWASKYIVKKSIISRKKRIGCVICTAGEPQDKADFNGTIMTLDIFYKCINTKLLGIYTIGNLDNSKAEDRPEELSRAYEMGKKLLEILKTMEG